MPLSLRRTDHDARMEIMPLIDVIFLLLTFFIYAMVLMVRPELVPMEMREFASGVADQPAPAMTISIDADGMVYLDREPITLEQILPRLEEAVAADAATVIYIAADERGTTDRLPVFFDLYDRLANAGLDIRLFSAPPEMSE
jgi:biopolymer transport protein ExbD